MRYRLARWLLGYRPIQIPDATCVYIVIRDGPVVAIITPKSIQMDKRGSLLEKSEGSFSGTW